MPHQELPLDSPDSTKCRTGDLNPSQRNPLLTRVEVRAGHGAGKPTAKVIAEVSDMLAFAAGVVGAPWVHGSA